MEETTFTTSQAHLHFAIEFHSRTWELLEKTARTQEENERMADYAHASLAHWRTAGTAVRHQRGEWLLARVYTVLGESRLALQHAYRCAEILRSNPAEMQDFDFAFAYEAVARAHALAGERAEAERLLQKAMEAAEKIAEEDDREAFFAELAVEPWNGVRVPSQGNQREPGG
jgi:tetratricopeptide (TPR) repeat protein